MVSIHSTTFKVVYFVSALLEIILFGGVIFGWASIRIVFTEEGFFSYLCTSQGNKTTAASWGHNITSAPLTCIEQNKRFNLVFNVAVAFLCFAQFPVGHFADICGPRATQIVGCILYTIAGLGLAFTTKETSYLLFPVFILMCVGGVFIAYAKFRVARVLYTNARSIAVSMLSTSFDSSAFILLLIKIVWRSAVPLRYISLFYAALCMVLASSSAIFLTPPYSVLKDEASRLEQSPISSEGDEENEILAKILPDTFKESILSPQYLLELSYLSICQISLWFFIGSLHEQISTQFPTTEAVNNYVTYFSYVQFCALLVGPITGLIFDRNSAKCRQESEEELPLCQQHPAAKRIKRMKESVLPFLLTNIFCLLISVLVMVQLKWALVMAFVLHVVTRAFLYSSHVSYIALAFRPERFATLNGLGIFTAGIFGLLEYPIYAITKKYLRSDPLWVNIIMTILVALASIFPFYLAYFCKAAEQKIASSSATNSSKKSCTAEVRL